jgi:uncharacterized protein YjiS (DUF1127 family)
VRMLLLRDLADAKVTPNWSPVEPETAFPPHRRSAMRWLLEAWERRRTRDYLTQLDDRMLKDIGVTRVEARREASKPFWLP